MSIFRTVMDPTGGLFTLFLIFCAVAWLLDRLADVWPAWRRIWGYDDTRGRGK